ncbi:MAG: hypothetical protein KTR29_18070 [Rhodothermaceae bacterium]|nr:hypothetical protein [Rhodothermaceae bacterium]
MKPCHVVILGCGRSGTSIFGELFDHLPYYSYYSEPDFSELLSHGFDTPLAVKVPRESPEYGATEGLSFPLDLLLSEIRSPWQMYWQVRHPLDTIASLRIGISRNWGHHPRPPDWRDWLERPLIEQCAHHWAYINTVGYQKVKDMVKITRFETMIEDPLRFATSISSDVGLVPDKSSAALRAWARRVQNTNNEHFIEAMTSRSYSRPDHTVRVGRWRENLSDEEVKSVIPIIKEAAEIFDYSLKSLHP